MIQRTFCHIPGIGQVKERLLWQHGIRTWDQLAEKLRSGARPADLLRGRDRSRGLLFPEAGVADGQAGKWLAVIEQSSQALEKKDYAFFLSRLPAHEHWRLLVNRLREPLYLDIETTGLSRELNNVTVIGALRGQKFCQWVWPEPLDELWKLMADATLVVTFNGRRFDLPFLEHHFPACPAIAAHVDLVYLIQKLRIPGGQKGAEKRFGLARPDSVEEVHGAVAVALWAQTLYGDRNAYRTLLAYNRADVEMMPRIAARACSALAAVTPFPIPAPMETGTTPSRVTHRPVRFDVVRSSWRERRAGLHLLLPKLDRRCGRMPTVVGIDLRGTPKNPTGMAVCQGHEVETQILHTDAEILRATIAAEPDIVSIDAPLSLPRGRRSVSDDSPCREKGGIVRCAERVLWSRRIPVYPSLIRHMQGLTRRGIALTGKLRKQGIPVIESYPGAAQDVLGIPRKGVDEALLALGLNEFGYHVPQGITHDELDAITSALVGYVFLAGEYEAIGADDEGYMILPISTSAMRWSNGPMNGKSGPRAICLAGLPGSGKTTLARGLSSQLRCKALFLGHELRVHAKNAPQLAEELACGKLAPEALVEHIVSQVATDAQGEMLVVDGFPRHPAQVGLANTLFANWQLVVLQTDIPTATARTRKRITCENCGWVGHRSRKRVCPVCNVTKLPERAEDDATVLANRLREAQFTLEQLLSSVDRDCQGAIDTDRDIGLVLQVAVEIVGTHIDKTSSL